MPVPACRSLRRTLLPMILLLGALEIPGHRLVAQVGVVVIQDKLGKASQSELLGRVASPMSWRAKAAELAKQGIKTNLRSPPSFTLTPRNPYRFPGGYLRLQAATAGIWRPEYPNPTGSIAIRNDWSLNVVIDGGHPNSRYVLDLSLSTGQSVVTLGKCTSDHFTITRRTVEGATHLLVVVPTDQTGDSCVGFTARPNAVLTSVEITDVGPAQ